MITLSNLSFDKKPRTTDFIKLIASEKIFLFSKSYLDFE